MKSDSKITFKVLGSKSVNFICLEKIIMMVEECTHKMNSWDFQNKALFV